MSHLEKVAEHFVDPALSPIVMPQRVPGRLGAATFPLVKEFSFPPSSLDSNFSILVSPDLSNPLRISRLPTVPEAVTSLIGNASYRSGTSNMTGLTPCDVVGQPYTDNTATGTLVSAPYGSAAGGTALFNISSQRGPTANVNLFFLTAAGSWSNVGNASIGGSEPTFLSQNVIIPPGCTRYAVYVLPLNIANDYSSHIVIDYAIVSTGGMTQTCSGTYNEHVMDTYFPHWDNVLAASRYAKVVACDCLVTYEGSTLDNAGSIAVANIEDDLHSIESGSIYEALASLPFDKYRGRLASVGQSEGGGHWHFVPTSEDQLEPAHASTNIPVGAFGISGCLPEQVVRIECHYTVNFFSVDPGYKMVIPPPAAGLSPLLWELRTNVPLCTSNDSHVLKRLKAGARKGAVVARKAQSAATSPEAIKLFSMLAPLIL